MQRVPNPPKLPTIAVAEIRRRGGLGSSHTRLVAIFIGALVFAACEDSILAGESVRPAAFVSECLEASPANIVVHGTIPSHAAIIVEHAEAIRTEAFARLLGESHPKPWVIRCEIHVHDTEASFEQAVGAAPAMARGATSLEFAGDRIIARRIDVMGDGPTVVPDAIDHELVHVVLADHFVHAPPPRWADEGLALLFDTPEKQRAHEADFQEARHRGLALSAAELVSVEEYPADSARQRAFYGQSAALVRWLIARRDPATFIRFLDDASDVGMEAALDHHYAITSLASVSSAWKEVAPINTLGLSERRR